MGKGELAEELFLKGYNCAQAVAGAFAEDIGMDFDTHFPINAGEQPK